MTHHRTPTRWKPATAGLATFATAAVAVIALGGSPSRPVEAQGETTSTFVSSTAPEASSPDTGESAATGASAPPPTTIGPPTTTGPDPTEPAHDVELGTITVSGHGEASVTPDEATIYMGATVRRPAGGEALDALGERSTALVESLKGLGVAPEDIQTAGLNLYPTTDRDGAITGYEASTNVTVTIHDLERAPEIIDGVQAFVGDELTLSGISFDVSDPSAAMADARAAAVDDARERAEQYAGAAGVDVGAVVQISEDTATPYQPRGAMPAPAAGDDAMSEVAIEPGQTDLTVDISVVFEIA